MVKTTRSTPSINFVINFAREGYTGLNEYEISHEIFT